MHAARAGQDPSGLSVSIEAQLRGGISSGAEAMCLRHLLSGAGPPLELLNGPLSHVSDVLPLTYAIRLMQNPWLGFGWDFGAMAIVLGFAGAAALGAFLTFRRE